jgi:hypothetical protein
MSAESVACFAVGCFVSDATMVVECGNGTTSQNRLDEDVGDDPEPLGVG